MKKEIFSDLTDSNMNPLSKHQIETAEIISVDLNNACLTIKECAELLRSMASRIENSAQDLTLELLN